MLLFPRLAALAARPISVRPSAGLGAPARLQLAPAEIRAERRREPFGPAAGLLARTRIAFVAHG
jgi:hypothetical protein